MKEKLIFENKKTRELFDIENLIGKNFAKEQYTEIFKKPELIEIFCNKQINKTVDAYLSAGQNITLASTNFSIHRNTLIYRLEKIKNKLGLDLKYFEDCTIYYNARMLFKMFKNCQDCESCKNCH